VERDRGLPRQLVMQLVEYGLACLNLGGAVHACSRLSSHVGFIAIPLNHRHSLIQSSLCSANDLRSDARDVV
jgi:hypothetical protein